MGGGANGEGAATVPAGSLFKVCRWFKERTGLGTDDLHPRALLVLSDAGEECYLRYPELVEASRSWPRHARCLETLLIPKPEGAGDRPIMKLASGIRLWEALRIDHLIDWQAEHRRDWDANGAGGARR